MHGVVVHQSFYRTVGTDKLDKADFRVSVLIFAQRAAFAQLFADRRFAGKAAHFLFGIDGSANGLFDGALPVIIKFCAHIAVTHVAAGYARAGVGVRTHKHNGFRIDGELFGKLHTHQTALKLTGTDDIADHDDVAAAAVVDGQHAAIEVIAHAEIAAAEERTVAAQFSEQRYFNNIFGSADSYLAHFTYSAITLRKASTSFSHMARSPFSQRMSASMMRL